MVLVLLLVVVALVLGIIATAVEGLFWLLFVGIGVLVLAVLVSGVLLGRRRARRPHR